MPLQIPVNAILVFMVVLARIGGLVSFAPFWSHKAVSKQVRAMVALVLALALTPMLMHRIPPPPPDLLPLLPILVVELLIGMVFGFVGRLVFMAIDVAAHVIGFQMGFSLAGTIDPATRAQTAALGVVAQMLGLVVLMSADGHHWFLLATVRSYSVVAVGNAQVTAGLVDLFLRLSADALAVGVALAAPAIVLLMAVELTLAVAGRAIPQIQVMILGFPIKIAVGLWLIGASLYLAPGALRTTLGAIRQGLSRAMTVM